MMETLETDILIIGAGITGLAIARTCREALPTKSVLIIEKEVEVATHASSRNSGVLHAGFYYTASSLKAKFCREGNAAWKKFCKENNLILNESGKLVVAKNAAELAQLEELERRGKNNEVSVELISDEAARQLEPAVVTYKKALHSPTTATLNPSAACKVLYQALVSSGVQFVFNCAYQRHQGQTVYTSKATIKAKLVINCAGGYADVVARDYGFSKDFTMLPFKGIYLPYTKNKTDLRMNIYPVPDLRMPFLGVHFTVTADHTIKVGPTATPAFWRENYQGFSRFSFRELVQVLTQEARLFITNKGKFRNLAFEEMKKYWKSYLISEARKLAPSIDPNGFGDFTKPGIRAQLLDVRKRELVQDFLVEADKKSIHVLNAVSPAFTCAFPFAEYIYDSFIKNSDLVHPHSH